MAEDNLQKEISRILIVDDVEANRFILRDIITEMGYLPMLTENGAQALKIVQRIKPQLIILDIAMPEMDGYEVCRTLKADPETKAIPIIFISAFDDPEDIVKGFYLGGEDYITKPFVPEVVKVRVGMHLKLYDANRRMAEMNRQLQVSIKEQLKQMEIERRSILYALIRVARENACYDEAYMERLSYNCRILTEAMQLSDLYGQLISDKYVDTMELAAPLCDLGNMAIPTNILQKQGALTEEESAIMRTHTTIGARILQDIGEVSSDNRLIQIAVEIAKNHHENWDGSGYPDGRKGEEIPLSAQIVAVVGNYCALTERRTYRGSFTKEEAFEIMEKDMDKKFNPNIFGIMKKIARQLK
ncbi:MAG: response regulator [Lachnospiraceae bacterium]|nr:response regulator [Lachnospiraceae bacterium]MBP3608808.1 response regulator [Lachnospiraceae bacterium]